MQRGGWILLALILQATVASAERVSLDGYAAIVNDRVITLGDVLATAAQMDEAAQGDASDPVDLASRLQRNYKLALKLQVDQALLVEEAKRRGAEKPERAIPERMIDDQVANIIREQFGNNRDAFITYMAERGMTMEDVRKQARERIEVYRMLHDEVQSRVLLSPASVKAEYDRRENQFRTPEQVHLRMIMIHRGETGEQAAAKRELALKARARLQKGESFTVVAQSVSEGFRASEGGDIGWMAPGDLKSTLQAAIQHMRAGEVSEVLDGDDGFYILELLGRREETLRKFEDVRVELEKELMDRAEDEVRKEFISRLRARHFVRFLIPDRPETP